MNKISNLWLTFLLKTKIKKIDFRIETVSPEISFDCCGPMALCIVAEYKWFWEKSTASECCDQ